MLISFQCLDNYEENNKIMNHVLKIVGALLETNSDITASAVLSLLRLCERFDDWETSVWLMEQVIDTMLSINLNVNKKYKLK